MNSRKRARPNPPEQESSGKNRNNTSIPALPDPVSGKVQVGDEIGSGPDVGPTLVPAEARSKTAKQVGVIGAKQVRPREWHKLTKELPDAQLVRLVATNT